MNKIKVGIVGYGNLGKALEKLLFFDKRFKLVKIFSRRRIEAKYVSVDDYQNIEKYAKKIDIMFLAGGSYSNLREQAERCIKNFCTIDAFDTHQKIDEHITTLNQLASKNFKTALCSLGWDPGLFSLYRVLTKSIEGNQISCWGKGVSQGHSEALRRLPEVIDAVQYTVPNTQKINALKSGKSLDLSGLHIRECFVYSNGNDKAVDDKIKSIPYYFKGQKVIINHVDKKNILRKKKLYHAGEVFSIGSEMQFKIKTKSNPEFTAKIMIAFAPVLYEFWTDKKFGAYSILDIPIGKLLENSKELI